MTIQNTQSYSTAVLRTTHLTLARYRSELSLALALLQYDGRPRPATEDMSAVRGSVGVGGGASLLDSCCASLLGVGLRGSIAVTAAPAEVHHAPRPPPGTAAPSCAQEYGVGNNVSFFGAGLAALTGRAARR